MVPFSASIHKHYKPQKAKATQNKPIQNANATLLFLKKENIIHPKNVISLTLMFKGEVEVQTDFVFTSFSSFFDCLSI
jgi:urease accessory protein UreH